MVSEPRPERQHLARELGATVIEPDSLELLTIVEPHRIVDEPFDAVLECSGKRIAMETGLCQLRRGGTLVLVGTGIDAPRFDPNRVLLDELLVTGAFEYDDGGIGRPCGCWPAASTVAPLLAGADVDLGGLLSRHGGPGGRPHRRQGPRGPRTRRSPREEP